MKRGVRSPAFRRKGVHLIQSAFSTAFRLKAGLRTYFLSGEGSGEIDARKKKREIAATSIKCSKHSYDTAPHLLRGAAAINSRTRREKTQPTINLSREVREKSRLLRLIFVRSR